MRRALIVIDVQQEYFDGALPIQYPPRDDSLANIVRALDTAEQHGLPTVVVRHEYPAGAPVFAAGSPGWALHPDVEKRAATAHRVTKSNSSAFAGTDLADWLADNTVDTITIAGYMTNNCDLATAASAEELGLATEILSDATGAIHLSNSAGTVDAQQLHETLLVLLNSNFASVATTDQWIAAVHDGRPLPAPDLGASAALGRLRASEQG
ncbi:cysteine hydrolase family protein [Cryptosporangium phraense]|uniref:Cysteine hydrolase n=1 Tax=Cryptosporangium phraense TaxID=2593070 RepID=A0A545AGI2_9ACTN|nr:cysteine hydrolase family protein [Cryptosporangium phraense]TQS39765.1 cysteine hydrolase [Cryptosporangium phraense]